MKKIIALCSLLLLALPCCLAQSQFTQMEINHVRVHTPGLFSHHHKIYIHLDSIPQDDYSFPLDGGKVISNYGAPRRRHAGIDIKTVAHDTIRAVFGGVVRMSKPYSAYGNTIVIRHPNGLETLYSHNSKNFVHSGDSVKAGQAIGLTGRTGRATTEHLHFETRINGHHFNPNLVLDMVARKLRKSTLEAVKVGSYVRVKALKKR